MNKSGKQVILAANGYETIAHECAPANSCTGFAGMPIIHEFARYQTVRIFSYQIEIVGRICLIEGNQPKLLIYVELIYG
jgi:hypothetical protein